MEHYLIATVAGGIFLAMTCSALAATVHLTCKGAPAAINSAICQAAQAELAQNHPSIRVNSGSRTAEDIDLSLLISNIHPFGLSGQMVRNTATGPQVLSSTEFHVSDTPFRPSMYKQFVRGLLRDIELPLDRQ